MQEEIVFKQLETVRNSTLDLLESIPESDWDVIPQGFRNNIRWNAGHIVTILDLFASGLRSISPNLPERYLAYFAKDTSPADWTDQPPAKEEIIQLLKEQPGWIRTACEGKLDEKLPKPFKGFETIGEVLSFGIFHDGLHTGIINAQSKVIKAEK
ncbi:DinB family protein [Scopulibacillus cellulosilyticus]|uniref:DinB family protein n=1 Tax=Scopulibacillus cellulosilyticus TaxID=2665665 RepID=A0ABW2Q494_9BACL